MVPGLQMLFPQDLHWPLPPALMSPCWLCPTSAWMQTAASLLLSTVSTHTGVHLVLVDFLKLQSSWGGVTHYNAWPPSLTTLFHLLDPSSSLFPPLAFFSLLQLRSEMSVLVLPKVCFQPSLKPWHQPTFMPWSLLTSGGGVLPTKVLFCLGNKFSNSS